MKGLVISIMAIALLWGCSSYQRFTRVFSGKQELIYKINSKGNVEQTGSINADLLVNDLLEGDVYRTIIEDFTMRSMSVKVVKNSDNTADSFRLLSITAGSLVFGSLSNTSDLLNQQQSLPVNESAPSIANTWLLVSGVGKINTIMKERLIGRRPDFVTGALGFTLRGTPIPANTLVSITLTISLDYSIRYSSCQLMAVTSSSLDDDSCK